MTNLAFDKKFNQLHTDIMYERIRDFFDAWINGPVYVELNGSARNGTIGIVDFSGHYILGKINAENYREIRSRYKADLKSMGFHESAIYTIQQSHSFRDLVQGQRWDYHNFVLRMDDGKTITPARFDVYDGKYFTWLKDYTGPTVNKFEKTSKPKVQAICNDRYGTELKVGDFIATTKGNELITGVITKITESGKSAYVKKVHGKGEVEMCSMSYNAVLIADSTKTNAMLRKLSS